MLSDSMLGSRLNSVTANEGAAVEQVTEACTDVRRLFAAHHAAILRLLRRFGVPEAQLDDAVQEVFWVAARRFADIQPGREKAFLYGVALRVASNELRRAQAGAEMMRPLSAIEEVLSDVAPSPEESLEQRRALALLDTALGRLPIELRSVLVLFELEGLEVSKIAEIEGVPLGTASSRLRRARDEFASIAKRMRAVLAKEGVPR